MEEHKKQETGGQLKTLWLVSGVTKKDITLEPVQVQEATLAERSVRWELGNTPTRISWSVVREFGGMVFVKVAAGASGKVVTATVMVQVP